MSRVQFEYPAKRRLYPWLARPHESRRVFHICQYKTASQWIQASLSDPRAYRLHRLQPYAYQEFFEFQQRRLRALPSSGLFLSFFSTHEEVKAASPASVEAFVVLRDPLKLLVSWYVSTRYTHPPTKVVLERRAILAPYDDEDGVMKMAEWFDEQARIPLSWSRQCEDRAVFLRFEDLVVRKTEGSWAAMATALGCPDGSDALLRIGHLYDRLVRLRSSRWFAGSKYAPPVKVDMESSRFADVAADLRTRFPDLFTTFAAAAGAPSTGR